MKEITGQELEFFNYYVKNDMFTVIYKRILNPAETVPSSFVEFMLMQSEIFAVYVKDDKTEKVIKIDSVKELKKICKGVNIDLRLKDASIKEASNLILRYGGTDGAHHKDWIIDQTLRILQLDNYEKSIRDTDPDGEYEWEVGIAP